MAPPSINSAIDQVIDKLQKATEENEELKEENENLRKENEDLKAKIDDLKEKKEETLKIMLKNVNGDEMLFKVWTKTKIYKIGAAYCREKGLQLNSLKFLYDGDMIDFNDTPRSLNLKNGARIDVHMEQLGDIG